MGGVPALSGETGTLTLQTAVSARSFVSVAQRLGVNGPDTTRGRGSVCELEARDVPPYARSRPSVCELGPATCQTGRVPAQWTGFK